MALTDAGKKLAMETGVFPDNVDRYVSLHLADGTELADNGYSREAVRGNNANAARDATTGAVTITDLDVYTAMGNGPFQDATQVALYSADAAGDQIYEPETLSNDPDAPALGATFRLTSLVFNP